MIYENLSIITYTIEAIITIIYSKNCNFDRKNESVFLSF